MVIMWTLPELQFELDVKELIKHTTFEIQTQKGSNERLCILTRTHSMQIFGEIPFIKPQNDT